MKIKRFVLRLETDQPVEASASQLRGFIATRYPDKILFHHHNTDKLMYQYPLVQYKIIKGVPVILGIGDGVSDLQEVFYAFDELELGNQRYQVTARHIESTEVEYGLTRQFYKYQFLTPWAALNEKNYQRYYSLPNMEERQELLRRTLAGNLLSMSKTLGYDVPDRIKADVDVHFRKSRMKDVTLMTFTGTFVVNFLIPDLMGIGKSVSRGFGAVEKIKEVKDYSARH